MIGGFVLSAIVGYYLLDSLAKLLNLRSLQKEVPDEFLDVYDATRYRRSQEYTKTNTLVRSGRRNDRSRGISLLSGFWADSRFWINMFGPSICRPNCLACFIWEAFVSPEKL